mmetsp:Transcript_41479/g.47843  ORF Transcript_41479/g.47843 Transcript_41479/m.47843 type:complete len:247 (-) Transcript_41479:24-764(-)
MWAAWRNNVEMLTFLLDNGANIHILNHEGEHALDICVKRLSYNCALILKGKGLALKDEEFYKDKLDVEYDLPLFLQYVEENKVLDSTKIFFEKIKKEDEEYNNKDLVIDPRETWKQWIKRTATFEEPPMVERQELPEKKQPHKSFFSKVENYVNGINPYPPGHKWNKKSNKIMTDQQNNDQQEHLEVNDNEEEKAKFEEDKTEELHHLELDHSYEKENKKPTKKIDDEMIEVDLSKPKNIPNSLNG